MCFSPSQTQVQPAGCCPQCHSANTDACQNTLQKRLLCTHAYITHTYTQTYKHIHSSTHKTQAKTFSLHAHSSLFPLSLSLSVCVCVCVCVCVYLESAVCRE